MRRILIVVAVLVCIGSGAQLFAQSTYATVSGSVADVSGAVLPGVSVTAANDGTGIVTSVITNEAGVYTLATLLLRQGRLEGAE